MSKKRDYVKEIISRKSRLLKGSSRWEEFSKRDTALIEAFYYLVKEAKPKSAVRNELLRYFPIGAVAILEGYFRLAIRDIIDAGHSYRNNIKNISDIKFNITNILAIYEKKITLGEFISHLLPINSLEDINRNISILINKDFLKELRKVKFKMDDDKPSITMGKVASDIYKKIKNMFELRHIHCHELAISEKLDIEEIRKMQGAVVLFVFVTDNLLLTLLEK